MRSRALFPLLTAAGILIGGCGGAGTSDDHAGASDAISDRGNAPTATTEHPEVALMTYNHSPVCMVTLLTQSVGITAAGCLPSANGAYFQDSHILLQKTGDGRVLGMVDRWKTILPNVLLVHLSTPATGLTYPPIGYALPSTTVDVYARMSVDPNALIGDPCGYIGMEKAKITTPYTNENGPENLRVCPADRGAPIFVPGEYSGGPALLGAIVTGPGTAGEAPVGLAEVALLANLQFAIDPQIAGWELPSSFTPAERWAAATDGSTATTCVDWGKSKGWPTSRCEAAGNGVCAGTGPQTSDCDHCCDFN